VVAARQPYRMLMIMNQERDPSAAYSKLRAYGHGMGREIVKETCHRAVRA